MAVARTLGRVQPEGSGPVTDTAHLFLKGNTWAQTHSAFNLLIAHGDFSPECVCFPYKMLQLSALGQCAIKALLKSPNPKSPNPYLHVLLTLQELPFMIAHGVLGLFHIRE